MGLSPSRGSSLTNRGLGLRGVSVDDGMSMFQRWMMALIYWMWMSRRDKKVWFGEGVVVLYSAILPGPATLISLLLLLFTR